MEDLSEQVSSEDGYVSGLGRRPTNESLALVGCAVEIDRYELLL